MWWIFQVEHEIESQTTALKEKLRQVETANLDMEGQCATMVRIRIMTLFFRCLRFWYVCFYFFNDSHPTVKKVSSVSSQDYGNARSANEGHFWKGAVQESSNWSHDKHQPTPKRQCPTSENCFAAEDCSFHHHWCTAIASCERATQYIETRKPAADPEMGG